MIAVIDYGMGNLRSVSKALESVGAEVKVTNNPEDILSAEAIVLPGVGAFYRGMKNLEKLGLAPAILEAVKKDKPFLGICLGLQILFSESEEHGVCKGLDIVKGKVKRFSSGVKIPHMGWNQLRYQKTPREIQRISGTKSSESFQDSRGEDRKQIFKDIPDGSYFYFVHSYYVEPEDRNIIAATTEYGKDFVSAVNKDNIWGVQFHPEKSSDLGLKILKNFVELAR